MAEETERQVKVETRDFKDEKQDEISKEAFESGIKSIVLVYASTNERT
jgi:hypothetical protein